MSKRNTPQAKEERRASREKHQPRWNMMSKESFEKFCSEVLWHKLQDHARKELAPVLSGTEKGNES